MKISVIVPVWNQEELVLRALNSVPVRNDIEIIVIDDNSTDGTYEEVEIYKGYSKQNIILLHSDTQLHPAGAMNWGIDVAQGEYITQLDSDDYLETNNFVELMEMRRTEDLIFFCNQSNNGEIWNPEKIGGICDHVCWYKRNFVGDTRMGKGKWGQGWAFHQSILAGNPSKFYYNKVVYHYNYPREGSVYDLGKRGLL